MVAQISHWQTTWTCQAERELLRSLEGGCSVPVGARSILSDEEEGADGSKRAILTLSAIIASLSGEKWIESSLTRTVSSEEEAMAVGADVAQDLISKGGRDILAELFVLHFISFLISKVECSRGRKVEDDNFRQRHEEAVKRAMERAKSGYLSPEDAALCGHPDAGLASSPRMQMFSLPQLPKTNGHAS